MMTEPLPRRSPLPILLALAIASAAGTAACGMDQPSDVPDALTGTRSAAAAPIPAVAQQPTFTPYTSKPELVDRAEVGRLLEEAYPPLLRDAGIGGTAVLWAYIDEGGRVLNTRVETSSGEVELDRAAERVMRRIRFTPAENEGEAVGVWIQLPVTFRAAERSGGGGAPADGAASAPRGVRFTPYDGRPTLRNRSEFGRRLEESYPPMLRDAGIGGTVLLWVHIDELGRVTQADVARSAGEPALDRAAREALLGANFSPATLAGEPTSVWIQLPVTFQPR